MCNHYASSGEWRTKMGVFRQLLPLFDWSAPRPNVQSDEVYPTNVGEILAPGEDGALIAAAASWLFMPWKPGLTWSEWSKTRRGCNNARGETAETTWPFKASAQRSRCLIPGEAFYEWDDAASKKDGGPGKTEYRFAYPDGCAFFFAGLCNRVEPPDVGPMLTYAMITKPAGGDTASIGHPRQPVILTPDDVAAWLDPNTPIASFTERLDPAGAFTVAAVKGPKASVAQDAGGT